MGATSRTGTRLGAFTVGPPLGRGGTAEIYHATEATTGRAVALKILREDLMQYEEIVARFYREARAAERVRHPNVVDVYAVGKDERGTPFIVLFLGIAAAVGITSLVGFLAAAESRDRSFANTQPLAQLAAWLRSPGPSPAGAMRGKIALPGSISVTPPPAPAPDGAAR